MREASVEHFLRLMMTDEYSEQRFVKQVCQTNLVVRYKRLIALQIRSMNASSSAMIDQQLVQVQTNDNSPIGAIDAFSSALIAQQVLQISDHPTDVMHALIDRQCKVDKPISNPDLRQEERLVPRK